MDQPMATRTVTVTNKTGLHARPAHALVKEAIGFQSSIAIIKGRTKADAKSMLDVLTLVAERGAELRIEAQGPDAENAVAALAELFVKNFGEPDEG
jgi:phosphotransferase system HPr (HPr) family protein